MLHLLHHSDVEYITYLMHIKYTRLAVCIDTTNIWTDIMTTIKQRAEDGQAPQPEPACNQTGPGL